MIYYAWYSKTIDFFNKIIPKALEIIPIQNTYGKQNTRWSVMKVNLVSMKNFVIHNPQETVKNKTKHQHFFNPF